MPRPRPSMMIATAVILAAGAWIYALLPRAPTLTVTFLDVGEGMNAVVVAPSGACMVVDCGTSTWRRADSVGEKVTAAYLRSLGINTIDVAVLTHPHSDHVSGYAGLLDMTPADLVLDTGAPHPSPHYKRFLASVKRCGATYRIARRGQMIDLGDGALVKVLSPDSEDDDAELNDRSIVLRITFGKTAILLPADVSVDIEDRILDSEFAVRSQVLQVGHHGSAESTSARWLAAVKPQVAVVSCGRRNEYGHPSPEVLGRLRAAGVRVYRTDRDGAVSITTNGTAISVRALRRPQ